FDFVERHALKLQPIDANGDIEERTILGVNDTVAVGDERARSRLQLSIGTVDRCERHILLVPHHLELEQAREDASEAQSERNGDDSDSCLKHEFNSTAQLCARRAGG